MNESFTEKTFEELGLKPELLRAVADMGFQNLTPVQQEAIPLMLAGTDVIGQAQTGTGKTAAFGLPILQKIDPENRDVQALILCPTRELAVQVAGELRSYAAYLQGVKTLPVYGGQDITRQITGLKGTQIVVGTPGRIMDHMRRHTLKLDDVHTVVLDEADEMLNMGFREDMEVILGDIAHPHQTSMFSATMPQAILELTNRFLNAPVKVQITKEELTIPNIDQFYYSVKREYKVQALVRLITFYNYRKCMIFCNMKSTVDTLVSELQKNGCMAEALHGDLSQFLRDAAMKRFRENDSCVLVATDIAARGIDVGDVEAVFNYDVPQEAEYYVHRIGRTGRAGKSGVSHTLVGSREFHKVRFIESICHSAMTERTVPTPEEIDRSRQLQALNQAYELLQSGRGDDYLLQVHSFCNEHAITPEELAAAFLTLKIGAKQEALDIDLPGKNGKKRRDEHRPRRDGEETGEPRRRGRVSEENGERSGHRDFEKTEMAAGRRNRREYGIAGEETSPRKKYPAEPHFDRYTRVDKDREPYDPKAQEKELREFRKKIKEEHYKWGNFDVVAKEYNAELKDARRGGKPRGEKSYEKRDGRERAGNEALNRYPLKAGRSDDTEPGKRQLRGAAGKDKSYPDKSDKKENSSRSRRILAAAVKDVNSRGWAAPAKKKKATVKNKH